MDGLTNTYFYWGFNPDKPSVSGKWIPCTKETLDDPDLITKVIYFNGEYIIDCRSLYKDA